MTAEATAALLTTRSVLLPRERKEICCFCPKMEKTALMSCDHQQKSKKAADVTEGS